MVDMAEAARESFDVEYSSDSKDFTKVQVHLFVRSKRHKLQVVKNKDKKCIIMDEIWLENVGALLLVQLKSKKTKSQHRQCLVVLSKKQDSDSKWDRMVFPDREGVDQLPCVAQLKTIISTKSLSATFKMKDISGETSYQLQCSRKYLAIIPEDGSHMVKRSEIPTFCRKMDGCIYAKCKDEISLVNELPSSTSVVKLQTGNGETLQYTLCNGRTADMVSREINAVDVRRGQEDPLPPKPVANIEAEYPSPTPALVHGDCGVVPPLGAKPFWIETIVPANPEDSNIYPLFSKEDPNLDSFLRNKREHIKSVGKRQHSKRFNNFVDVVKIEPTMVDVSVQSIDPVYNKPRLSRLITKQPTISTGHFSKDNVETTLAHCLKNIIKRNFEHGEPGVTETCPIGLTNYERETFCWRLDLIEYDVINGPGWKVFAQIVMQLNNDDLDMIDEFSCKYKCQVVEVVLDHWHKLYKMNSLKCTQPAIKRTIIKVLNEMQKVALLKILHWENEQY